MTDTDPAALLCKSCRREFQTPATQIAHVKLDEGGVLAWPVCDEHAQWALVASWFPIDPILQENPDNG